MKKYHKEGVLLSTILKLSFLSGLLAATGGGQPAAAADETSAVSANDFLNSIGVVVHVQQHQPPEKLVEPLKYAGVRNVRDTADQSNFDTTGLLLLHKEAGVHVIFGPGSGATDDRIPMTIKAGKELAAADALLAIEGPNEPNNFGGVTYGGKNSNTEKSWLPVAYFQRDLYKAVKSDPVLKNYPVFGVSEVGAEVDNVGLQFLTIPKGAGTLMPDGTQYADYATCHNYVAGHIAAPGLIDNQPTVAADANPTSPGNGFDNLYGSNGNTWLKHFPGYTESELATIPKVTTETGWKADNTPAGDDRQGKMLLNVYLAQYKAGWKYTCIYEFVDDRDGSYGFYKNDFTTRRKSADYLHNFTTILADTGTRAAPGKIKFSIQNQPATVHDLLMQKKNGTFELAVWGEQVTGENNIKVDLGTPCKLVKVYDPTIGAKPVQTLNNANAVPLTVSDHVLLVEFK